MKSSKLIILTALCVAAACGPLGKYEAVTELPQDMFGAGVDTDTTRANIANYTWREVFTDPCLTRLIEQALENNKDLLSAQEKIAQAEASLTKAKWAYSPSLNLVPDIGYTFTKEANPAPAYNIAGKAVWEIDLKGSMANQIRLNRATLEQKRDYYQGTRASLIAQVANGYYTLLMLDSQYETTMEMLGVWTKTVQTIHRLKRDGFADEVAVSQYEATYAKLSAKAEALLSSIRSAENSICVLIGSYPDKIERTSLIAQTVPDVMSAGAPVSLLSRRPDVREAQRGMEAAFYNTKDAWLKFFPTLTITGYGTLYNAVTGAFSPMTALADVTAGLVAPIFNQGSLRANLKVSESKQRQAKLAFEQTLLVAASEVNNSIAQFNACGNMKVYYQNQVMSLSKARKDTELLMQNSESKTYLDVLMAHNELFDAEFNMISNQAQYLQAVVSIYRALGGGAEYAQ